MVPGAQRSATAHPCEASTKRRSLKNAPSVRARALQLAPPSSVAMSPVSVVANPTFASSRWIGPASVAENGRLVAAGDADAGTVVGGTTEGLCDVAAGLGAAAGRFAAHAARMTAIRQMAIRMGR